MTKFSIILPVYNAEATIAATLDSLTAQSFADWEAICIDDGSTDASTVIITDMAKRDPRIRLVCNSGKGPSDGRNMGADTCALGDIVAFCDADDIWTPAKLAELYEVFTDEAIDGAFGQIGFFNHRPADARVFSAVPKGPLTIDRLLGENPVCTMSNIALRRDVFRDTGGFDTTMVHNEDLEWLIRLVGQGARIVGVNALHTYYRTSPGGLSTDLTAMLAGRVRALETAARFGVQPSARSHAIHHRYLARRALRTGAKRTLALRFALKGLAHSLPGFFSPARRGALTLIGAIGALFLPGTLRRALFS